MPHLGGFADTFRLFAIQRFLAAGVRRTYAYLDLLRLGFGFLGQRHLQHALVVIGLDVLAVDRRGQGEGAGEAAVLALDPAVVLFFLLLLELALAVNGERGVLDANVDVLLVDAGDFDFERDVVLIFADVNRGREASGRGGLFLSALRIAEQTVHAVLQGHEFAEWIPPGDECHGLHFLLLEIFWEFGGAWSLAAVRRR